MSTEITKKLCALASSELGDEWQTSAMGNGPGWIVSFVNPYSVNVAKRLPSYLVDLQSLDQVLIDGSLLAGLASRFTQTKIERASFDGNSLAPEVLAFCNLHQLKVAIVGAKDDVASKAATVITRSYTSIAVALTRDGFFTDVDEINRTIAQIIAAGVNVVIVGMGAPYQESFLLRLRANGFRGAAFSCGGYLDQLCQGSIAYYPDFVERMNLRAPYRLIKEPNRLARRYFFEYFDFYAAATKMLLFRHKVTGQDEGK